MSTNVAALITLLCTLFWCGETFAQRALKEGDVDRLDLRAEFVSESNSELIQWSHLFEKPGSRYLRLHFSNIKANPVDSFAVTLRDRNGQIVAEYDQTRFGSQSSFWTDIANGSYARVEVSALKKPKGLSFDIDQLAFQHSYGAKYSISGADEREPIILYKDSIPLYIRARSVAKLLFMQNGIPVSCNGFLVATTRFLTNEHCISNEDECASARALFGYQYAEDGGVQLGQQVDCKRVVESNRELDFSLIQLNGRPGLVWGMLQLDDSDPKVNEQTYLIQHPGGEPKQISRKGCTVVTMPADGRASETDIGHKCDTLEGSSGSPLLGPDFRVVGLHHFGFEDSGRWSKENRAVRASLIQKQLADELRD
jgi:V8-like Glu-specific endopeptidase